MHAGATPPPDRGTVRADEAELRVLVATADRVLHHQRLAGHLTHASARVPGTARVVIGPRRPAPGGPHGRAADMVVIDLDGNLLEGGGQPPAERFIHTEIYRARPDVLGVVHTHQPKGTLIGVLGADLLPLLHLPAVLTGGGGTAMWPSPLPVTEPGVGRQLAVALGGHRLCHLQGHGIVSVAADLRLATVAAIAMEQLAEANLEVLRTGRRPRVISPTELDEIGQLAGLPDAQWTYYAQTSLVDAP